SFPPHNPPTRAAPRHPRAPPPLLPAPRRAHTKRFRSHPTRSGTRAASPAHPHALETQSHHSPDTAPGLPSGTVALQNQRRTDQARTALTSAQVAANSRATHPDLRYTTLPALPLAPAASIDQERRLARSLSVCQSVSHLPFRLRRCERFGVESQRSSLPLVR